MTSGYVAIVLLCTWAWVDAGNTCTEEVAIWPTPMQQGPFTTKAECIRAVDDMTVLIVEQVDLPGAGWFYTTCYFQQAS